MYASISEVQFNKVIVSSHILGPVTDRVNDIIKNISFKIIIYNIKKQTFCLL